VRRCNPRAPGAGLPHGARAELHAPALRRRLPVGPHARRRGDAGFRTTGENRSAPRARSRSGPQRARESDDARRGAARRAVGRVDRRVPGGRAARWSDRRCDRTPADRARDDPQLEGLRRIHPGECAGRRDLLSRQRARRGRHLSRHPGHRREPHPAEHRCADAARGRDGRDLERDEQRLLPEGTRVLALGSRRGREPLPAEGLVLRLGPELRGHLRAGDRARGRARVASRSHVVADRLADPSGAARASRARARSAPLLPGTPARADAVPHRGDVLVLAALPACPRSRCSRSSRARFSRRCRRCSAIRDGASPVRSPSWRCSPRSGREPGTRARDSTIPRRCAPNTSS